MYRVWRDDGVDGWHIVGDAEDWEGAVSLWCEGRSDGNKCVMTEIVPVRVLDGRQGAQATGYPSCGAQSDKPLFKQFFGASPPGHSQ